MKATTMLETIRSLLGVPACAIPLSICKPAKTYLLDKAGISPAGTAILFAIPYLVTGDVCASVRNLSLYAVPRDYHGYMKMLEGDVLPSIRCMFPDFVFASFADHSPLCEVDAAARAGLGVVGMNGLLLTPDHGSFVFLGEIITDADYTAVTGATAPEFPAIPPVCNGCGACIKACSMGCRDGDRSACLSAMTQKKGAITPEEASAILAGGLIWGCDTCQLACPHNIRIIREGRDTTIPYFREERILRLDDHTLQAMSDDAFASRAYAWRGRTVIARNIALFEGCVQGKQVFDENSTSERSEKP